MKGFCNSWASKNRQFFEEEEEKQVLRETQSRSFRGFDLRENFVYVFFIQCPGKKDLILDASKTSWRRS